MCRYEIWPCMFICFKSNLSCATIRIHICISCVSGRIIILSRFVFHARSLHICSVPERCVTCAYIKQFACGNPHATTFCTEKYPHTHTVQMYTNKKCISIIFYHFPYSVFRRSKESQYILMSQRFQPRIHFYELVSWKSMAFPVVSVIGEIKANAHPGVKMCVCVSLY